VDENEERRTAKELFQRAEEISSLIRQIEETLKLPNLTEAQNGDIELITQRIGSHKGNQRSRHYGREQNYSRAAIGRQHRAASGGNRDGQHDSGSAVNGPTWEVGVGTILVEDAANINHFSQ
jgi:hypothetical protein